MSMPFSAKFLSLHRKVLFFAALVLMAIFTVFRFSMLENSPPGFFVDESSIGLNAYTILKTGADEHGVPFPLYFKAFGDYKNPIYIYSVVPLLEIFGVSVHAVRLASALWGAAALLAFGLIMWRARASRLVIALALMVVVTNPWLVTLSRVAFEVASFPFFLFTAAGCLYALIERKITGKWMWASAVGFGLSLGLLFYSYTAARLVSPLLLALGAGLLWYRFHWRVAAAAVVVWALCFVPLFLSDSFQNGALFARYSVVGLSRYTDGPVEYVVTLVTQYFAHFTPAFLRGGGDKNLRHTLAPYGVFLTSSLPIIATGIYYGVWKQRSLFAMWMGAGILISLLPSALTIDSPHVLRAVGALVFCLLFTWYGIEAWAQTKNRTLYSAGAVCLWLVMIESIRLLNFATVEFPKRSEAWYDAKTVEAIEMALQHPGPYYFSAHLYPGTDATVGFLAAKWNKTLDESNTTFYDPNLRLDITKGVVVSDKDPCERLKASSIGEPRLYENYATCMLWYEF